MPKVVKIEPAKALPSLAGSLTCLKVAAYARVSTDQDAQMSSFEAQKDYYEKWIGSHPGWTLVGIYADRGISETSSEKRPEFNRMLQDCRDGKIQMILAEGNLSDDFIESLMPWNEVVRAQCQRGYI